MVEFTVPQHVGLAVSQPDGTIKKVWAYATYITVRNGLGGIVAEGWYARDFPVTAVDLCDDDQSLRITAANGRSHVTSVTGLGLMGDKSRSI